MKFIYILLLMCIVGCTKEYIQHPTCRRFREFHDTSPDSVNNIETVEVFPESSLSQIACDSILTVLENDKPYWFGCITGGWERYRYIIQY